MGIPTNRSRKKEPCHEKVPTPPKSLQTIAGEWHSGSQSCLYAYASTGTILPGLEHEIKECFPRAKPRELADLQRLYVTIASPLTPHELFNAGIFWSRLERNADGSPLRAYRNGITRWGKTRPDDFRVPVKYGIETCFAITRSNAAQWCAAPRQP